MADTKYADGGMLYRNPDKNDPNANPKWPDYKGSVNVGDQQFWLSGWAKDGDKGKYISFSLTPKQRSGNAPKPPQSRQRQLPVTRESTEEQQDDIPF